MNCKRLMNLRHGGGQKPGRSGRTDRQGRLTPPDPEAQTIQDFLMWAMKFWNATAPTTRLLSLLQVIGTEVPRELTLLPSQWLSYVEGLLARRELTVKSGDEKFLKSIMATPLLK